VLKSLIIIILGWLVVAAKTQADEETHNDTVTVLGPKRIGYAIVDMETNHFFPCGSNESWWMSPNEETYFSKNVPMPKDGIIYFAIVYGMLTELEESLPLVDRQLHVTKVENLVAGYLPQCENNHGLLQLYVNKYGELPTDEEIQELNSLSRAGRNHFFLLLILVAAVLLIFVVPESFKLAVGSVAIVLLLMCIVSHINMQYFQSCPRCKSRLNTKAAECVGCGLNILYRQPPKHQKGWYD
jgi:hypothetical protein